jgi:hypothetical protein
MSTGLGMLAMLLPLAPASVRSQTVTPAAPAMAGQPAPIYSAQQLDQLLAPIALYPDPLLAQILMAATYPLEVVQAARWLEEPSNATLRGDQLAAALEPIDWDPSVKALVAFPRIVQMMNGQLQWMQQLGDAFLAQQGEVMDAVQRLRRQAEAAGNLATTTQQVVTQQGPDIVVGPANPGVIYVPYYNPTVVYGAWPYPAYPPYYFPPPPGYVYAAGLYFGIGFAIVAPLWGWDDWDWRHRYIHIDADRYNRINRYDIERRHRPALDRDRWEHDPYHRRGVAYRDPADRARFTRQQSGSPAERRAYRGYATAAPSPAPQSRAAPAAPRTQRQVAAPTGRGAAIPPQTQAPVAPNVSRTAPAQHLGGPTATTQRQANVQRAPATAQRPPAAQRSASPAAQRPAPSAPRAAPSVQHPAPPAFTGISRGAEIRAQSNRGHESQRTVAASPPRNAAHPAPAAHPAAGHGAPGAAQPSTGGGGPRK